MDRFRAAVRSAEAAITEILVLAQGNPQALKRRHRRIIELELESLRTLERSLSNGQLSRRTWSFGQATIPILNTMLTIVGRSELGVSRATLDRAKDAVDDLAEQLIRVAEGRP